MAAPPPATDSNVSVVSHRGTVNVMRQCHEPISRINHAADGLFIQSYHVPIMYLRDGQILALILDKTMRLAMTYCRSMGVV